MADKKTYISRFTDRKSAKAFAEKNDAVVHVVLQLVQTSTAISSFRWLLRSRQLDNLPFSFREGFTPPVLMLP